MNPIILTLLAGCADEPIVKLLGPAHPASPSSLADSLEAADAAFHGTVVSTDFRMSEPDPSGASVPYTFITWEVEHGFRGVEAGQRYTIRCLGGPVDGDRALFVSTIPVFQVGDEDVIFARTDNDDACPLVGAIYGRVRVEQGRIYDNFGASLEFADGDELVSVGWRYFPRAHRFDVGGVEIERTPSSFEPVGAAGAPLAELVDVLGKAALLLEEAPLAPSANPALPIHFLAARQYE